MLEHWNKRYAEKEYAYGTNPNVYLKSVLENLKPGKILFPCEGEGRNAVCAARLGWEVVAFDYSAEGKMKAEKLAKENQVEIDYQVGEFEDLDFPTNSFDAIALIFAHFQGEKKLSYHQKLNTFLKPGGLIIFEAFSKEHIPYRSKNPGVGGPTDLAMLYSCEEISNAHPQFENLELKETAVTLSEGLYHQGQGSVIRYLGRKL